MSSLEELRALRLKKLELLREAFGEVYPSETHRTLSLADSLASFTKLLKSKKLVVVAGRVRALRPHGGSIFFDIEENGTRLQVLMQKDAVDAKLFDLFTGAVDIGDFVEVSGRAYVTKRKEKSIAAEGWRILAKNTLPLPEKWHGLTDQEERYRLRALDLLANDKAREIFILRAKALGFIRSYFEKNGFIEVETPVLQHIPGGATARPFATHHNALDIPLYLRVAPELYLKRLVVGGFDRVFEIARNFRNEGIDVTHNPEFTMLEAYMAYSDYKSLMHFLEEFIKKLFSAVIKQKLPKQFKRISFYDTLRQYALMPHIETMPDKDIEIAAKRFGVPTEGKRNSELLEDIFRKAARPHLSAPTFVVDWPRELLPLAKAKPDAPHIAESFQLYIKGIELIKGFSELNDPKIQRELFMKQEDLRKKGDEEAQRIDEDFIQNLEYGMPPTAGFGIGIDRLMLVLADTPNVREVILFPTMRSKNR